MNSLPPIPPRPLPHLLTHPPPASKVMVDYQRDIPQTSGETAVKRAFATVTLSTGGKSLQETMVESGMATVARLRQDDPRTEGYDAIVAAEAAAKAAKKGVHAGGESLLLSFY